MTAEIPTTLTGALREIEALELRLAEKDAALDRFQSAALQARAEVEHLQDRLGAADQDLTALQEENRALREKAATAGEATR